jgi:DNA mismatch endonuclease (patch repair protein)
LDVLTKEQRHKNMTHIRNRDTKAEILLRKALWHKGVRYRKNDRRLPGIPDIAITKSHIAIFVDGDFWHGRNLESLTNHIDTHKDFWKRKLTKNVERDKEVNDNLTEMGWLVLRFWETDIKKDLEGCVSEVMKYIPITNDSNHP